MKNFTFTQKITAAVLITLFTAALLLAQLNIAGFNFNQLLN